MMRAVTTAPHRHHAPVIRARSFAGRRATQAKTVPILIHHRVHVHPRLDPEWAHDHTHHHPDGTDQGLPGRPREEGASVAGHRRCKTRPRPVPWRPARDCPGQRSGRQAGWKLLVTLRLARIVAVLRRALTARRSQIRSDVGFSRHWHWVRRELRTAYRLGREGPEHPGRREVSRYWAGTADEGEIDTW